jgi:flagellar hook assembly protein FlgD
VSGVPQDEGGADMTPSVSALEQNFPNPFNPSTKIALSVAEAGPVVLTIFDAAGRPVRTLVNQSMAIGRYERTWDGLDDSGRPVGSGVYFLRIEVAGRPETKKMVLLK